MIDLHCHILPGLDDGAQDLDDALAMAAQAGADGIEAVCATPHIRHDHDVRITELPARLAELNAVLTAAGSATRVLPGGEVAATALAGLSDCELAQVTLGGGGKWVLLEPPSGPMDDRLAQAVDDVSRRGFRCLIAHPERHLGPELSGRLRAAIDRGALVQATAAWLTEPGTQEGMLMLAREGLIHVLGSDAHSSRAGRPVAIGAGIRALASLAGLADHLEWIAHTAPRAIVRGEVVRPPF
jgi:protein-tyrosine phosphatase